MISLYLDDFGGFPGIFPGPLPLGYRVQGTQIDVIHSYLYNYSTLKMLIYCVFYHIIHDMQVVIS